MLKYRKFVDPVAMDLLCNLLSFLLSQGYSSSLLRSRVCCSGVAAFSSDAQVNASCSFACLVWIFSINLVLSSVTLLRSPSKMTLLYIFELDFRCFIDVNISTQFTTANLNNQLRWPSKISIPDQWKNCLIQLSELRHPS